MYDLINERVRIISIDSVEDNRGGNLFPYDASIKHELGFDIVQINQSFSKYRYTLRGLHFQREPFDQAKIIQCITGTIYSVAVDIRPNSSTFGHYFSETLSGGENSIMYIPKGFAHGFLTLTPDTFVQWCVNNNFHKDAAVCLRWDSCGIEWPQSTDYSEYIISDKDRNGIPFNNLFD